MTEFSTKLVSLWAKKDEKDGSFYWLPLVTHLKDTMLASQWLWEHWMSSGQRMFVIDGIRCSNAVSSSENARRLVGFLGAIHDIGKATPVFQIQPSFRTSKELDHILLERLEKSGFNGISQLILASPRSSHHSLAGESILHQFGVKDDIGSIVGGHHGRPIDDSMEYEEQIAYAANYYQSEDPASPEYGNWKNMHWEIFQWAMHANGFQNPIDIPEISKPVQVILSGLVIMADWIASNESYFPLIGIEENDSGDEVKRFKDGMTTWYKNQPIEVTSFPEANQLFQERFGFAPRDFQRIVYETVSGISEPGILIIEAPTGSGKTEAALAAAEVLAQKTGRSGLFFGLPTQATSNGIFSRVHEWLTSITHTYGNASIRLSHGKSALNEEMQQIAAHINEDDQSNGSVFVNEWFSGRKTSALDDFVVGTVDYFLMTALKQKHLALRHLGFSKKIVVIDEVHAYDTYMQQYLFEAIRWMGSYHVPVILLSATLPSEQRAELVKQYLRGMDLKPRDMVGIEEVKADAGYPLLSYTDGHIIRLNSSFPKQREKEIILKKLEEDDLLERLNDLLRNGGIAGIIVNTVRKAQQIAEQCIKRFGESNVELLHSSFIDTERTRKENYLMHTIGKGAVRPYRRIIIGTQVIEQSLDIDFDVLISDLCPIDLLIQRIGRLHRHDIDRPEKHKIPVTYILGTNSDFEFQKGSSYVYGDYYLIRTQCCLPDKILVPSDVPELIREVYGSSELVLSEELRKKYRISEEKHLNLIQREEMKAKHYRLGHPKSIIKPEKYNLIGWLENPDDSDSEERSAAQVRDIQETIEVIALRKIGSGYGFFERDEDISEKVSDPHIAKEIAQQTLRLPYSVGFGVGTSRIIEELEAYNRKNLFYWQDQPWLKGSLGVIFDEKNSFRIGESILNYDSTYGLRVERRKSEQI